MKIFRFTFWIFFIIFLLPIGDFSYTAEKNNPKGKLKIFGGIRFVKLYGSYYQMGRQYGAFLREPLVEIQKTVAPFKAQIIHEDFYLHLKNNLPVQYQAFLRGISKSSEISYENLLIDSFYEVSKIECTAILAKATTDNASFLLHAKNRDTDNGKNQVVIEFNPDHGYRFIVTATIGALFLHQGMNEKGISVTGNGAPVSDYNVRMLPKDDIYRVILESAASLNEVDRIITAYQSDYAEIITVGSANELNGAIYDIGNVKRIKHEMKDQPCLFVTNYFLSDELTPTYTRLNDIRYQMIYNYVATHPINSIERLINLLTIPPVNNHRTVNSIIFNAGKREIYFAFSERYAASSQWIKYDWAHDKAYLYQ